MVHEVVYCFGLCGTTLCHAGNRWNILLFFEIDLDCGTTFPNRKSCRQVELDLPRFRADLLLTILAGTSGTQKVSQNAKVHKRDWRQRGVSSTDVQVCGCFKFSSVMTSIHSSLSVQAIFPRRVVRRLEYQASISSDGTTFPHLQRGRDHTERLVTQQKKGAI